MAAHSMDCVDNLYSEFIQPSTFLGHRYALYSYQDPLLFGIKKPDATSFVLWRLDLPH